MLDFTIFGIPVRVEPWFWLTSFFLGGGFHYLQRGEYHFILAWMIIVFISILIHELGHALVGIREGGGRAQIKLWAMGGLAYSEGAQFTRSGHAKMIAAGPLAGIALYVVVCLITTMIWWENRVGFDLVLYCSSLNYYVPNNPHLGDLFAEHYSKVWIVKQLIWVNLVWSLVNFLPVYPLDGGQFYGVYSRSRKKVHQVGMITATLFACIGLFYFKELYIAVLFGFLAGQNYLAYKQTY